MTSSRLKVLVSAPNPLLIVKTVSNDEENKSIPYSCRFLDTQQIVLYKHNL